MFAPINYNSDEKIWSVASRPSVFNPNCSIGRSILFMMRKRLNDICQISDTENTQLTFGTASLYGVRIAQYLKAMDLNENHVIGFVTSNTTLVLPTVIGCWFNATPIHAVNPINDETIIRHLFGISKPKLIFCDGQHYAKVRQATSDLSVKIYTLYNHLENVPKVEDLLEPTNTEWIYQPEDLKHGPNQTMAIMCSSGTGGMPKCSASSNASFLMDIPFIDSSTVTFVTSGLDWGTGIIDIMLTVLSGAKRIITTKPITTDYMLEIVEKYEVNYLFALPMQMSRLAHSKLITEKSIRSLQWLCMTGSACSPATMSLLKEQIPNAVIVTAYGCTEFGGIAADISNTGALGTLVTGIELKILDPDTLEPQTYNNVGEICVRSARKWLGYINNQDETSKVLDAEGWIHTGDLGYMDDNDVLYFVDRCKDILKFNGMQFSPHDIEEIIVQMPEVIDCCVFGIYDENYGDCAAAAIIKKPGCTLSEADVIQYVATKQKMPHKQLNYGVFFVNELIHNSNGKLMRRKVKEFCLRQNKLAKI